MSTRTTTFTGPTPDLRARRPGLKAVLAYFVLAWLLSALWLVPLVVAGRVVDAGRGWPTHFPALLGPALAAVIVSAVVGGRP
jgi:CAAX protease family protein